MIETLFKFLTVAGESLNKVLSRRWGNQTSAEAGTSNAIDTLEEEWRKAISAGDLARANDIRNRLIGLLNKTTAKRIAD